MKRRNLKIGIMSAMLIMMSSIVFITCEEAKKESSQLTIVNVSGPTKKDCGGFSWQVSFKLNPASPKGGWIVQKITIDRKATVNCPNVYAPINKTYWEAWKVNAGKDVTTYLEANAADYDDMFSAPSWYFSEGYHINTGGLKFFEELALPAGFVARNPRTYAGDLPSTDTEPDFWSGGDAVAHNLSVVWDCCDESTSTLEPVPDFNEKPKVTPPPKGGKFFEDVELLKPWTADSGYSQADNYLLVQHAMALHQLSDNEIITGVAQYAAYYAGDLDAMSKLFLVLRILYNVPDSIPIEQAQSFGGWLKPTADMCGPYYKLLWPMGWINPFPVPVVVMPFPGYIGAPYDPVGELEYFMETFGRRII